MSYLYEIQRGPACKDVTGLEGLGDLPQSLITFNLAEARSEFEVSLERDYEEVPQNRGTNQDMVRNLCALYTRKINNETKILGEKTRQISFHRGSSSLIATCMHTLSLEATRELEAESSARRGYEDKSGFGTKVQA